MTHFRIPHQETKESLKCDISYADDSIRRRSCPTGRCEHCWGRSAFDHQALALTDRTPIVIQSNDWSPQINNSRACPPDTLVAVARYQRWTVSEMSYCSSYSYRIRQIRSLEEGGSCRGLITVPASAAGSMRTSSLVTIARVREFPVRFDDLAGCPGGEDTEKFLSTSPISRLIDC